MTLGEVRSRLQEVRPQYETRMILASSAQYVTLAASTAHNTLQASVR